MNRPIVSILIAITTATFLIAFAAIAWRHNLVEVQDLTLRPRPLGGPILIVVGLMLVGILRAAWPALHRREPQPFGDHQRHLHLTLLLLFSLVAICQGWNALMYVEAQPDSVPFVRFALIFFGVLVAVRGNGFAKLDPPRSNESQDQGAWTRSGLQTGWAMVLLGVALTVAAVAAPMTLLPLVCAFAGVAFLALTVARRRALRRQA
jgi:hypothetical protein